MAQDSDQASSLGPITEERLRQAFSDRALISLDAAGKLLGIDVKALREMAMDGAIRTVVVGRKTRRFTEAHNQIVPERGLSARTASSSETTDSQWGEKADAIQ